MLGRVLASAAEDLRRRRERAKALVVRAAEPLGRRALHQLMRMAKRAAVADPDMWPIARAAVERAMDAIAEDLELELEQNLREACLQVRGTTDLLPPPSRRRCSCCVRVRNLLLHRLLPHDRSIWGGLRDPLWLLGVLAMHLPCYCIRVVAASLLLAMHCLPWPGDEYQLTGYILQLKASQFLSAGLGALVLGAMKYFFCICFTLDDSDLLHCVNDDGLMAFDLRFCVADYVSTFLLCRLALCALRRSSRLQTAFVGLPSEVLGGEQAGAVGRVPADLASLGRQGRLVAYDSGCFVASLAGLLVLSALTCIEVPGHRVRGPGLLPQIKANVYWCKVLYALLAFPFLFLLPPIATLPFSLVTRARSTGYDKLGRCVAFRLRVEEPRGESDSEPESGSDDSVGSSDSEPRPTRHCW